MSLREFSGPLQTEHVLRLEGLEADNLLAQLALIGLLEALEMARPSWSVRASWRGPPWVAHLHVPADATPDEIASAAVEGVTSVVARYDTDGRKNVDFEPAEFRSYAERCLKDPVAARLAATLASEYPVKRDGGLQWGPLVMMFGGGRQNFLERLIDVPLGRKANAGEGLNGKAAMATALFSPWSRKDATQAFRWDPEEDQRYALRHGEPSKAGAPPTVHGANRLAVLGLLTFPSVPVAGRTPGTPAVMRRDGEIWLLWPIWTEPLSLAGLQRLLAHPVLLEPETGDLRALGVAEVLRTRRISNGRLINVTRAMTWIGTLGSRGRRA